MIIIILIILTPSLCVEQVKLLREPEAAALAYGLTQQVRHINLAPNQT